jgi:hypothetical protein
MTATTEQYERADELCRAAMAIRPDLPQNQSLDDWAYERGHKLTVRERAVIDAAMLYHPDYNEDL